MGEVKGLDFPNVIVYPTENMLTWINNTTKQLADETRAKLYVAVTRAEITIGIIVPDDFVYLLNLYFNFGVTLIEM